jgi:hypothetical protein
LLNVMVLNVVMLNVIMLNVIMLNVVMLNVVARFSSDGVSKSNSISTFRCQSI